MIFTSSHNQPDYSIPVEEVYKRTAVQLIKMHRDPAISIQQSLGLSLDESSNLPSWVLTGVFLSAVVKKQCRITGTIERL
jgi:hypothetical protein